MGDSLGSRSELRCYAYLQLHWRHSVPSLCSTRFVSWPSHSSCTRQGQEVRERTSELSSFPFLLSCLAGLLSAAGAVEADRGRLPNQPMKLTRRGGRLVGNGLVLMAAAPPRSLWAIR